MKNLPDVRRAYIGESRVFQMENQLQGQGQGDSKRAREIEMEGI